MYYKKEKKKKDPENFNQCLKHTSSYPTAINKERTSEEILNIQKQENNKKKRIQGATLKFHFIPEITLTMISCQQNNSHFVM